MLLFWHLKQGKFLVFTTSVGEHLIILAYTLGKYNLILPLDAETFGLLMAQVTIVVRIILLDGKDF